MVVKRVGVISLAKLLAAINAVFGFLFGLMFALMSLVGASFANSGAEGLFGLVFGVAGVFFVPIFYGIMGFVSGVLTAVLYNFFAGMVGGLELDLVNPAHAAPAGPSADAHGT